MNTATSPQASIPSFHAPISESAVAGFRTTGCLLLRQLISPAMIAEVRQAVADVVDGCLNELKAKGLIDDTRPDLPLERRWSIAGKHSLSFGRSWTERLAVPGVFNLHHHPALLDALQAIMGPDINGHRQFNFRPKLPGQELTTVPWHQDSAYFGEETAEDLIITVWIPLVEATEANGCMQVVPFSDREGYVKHLDANDEGGFLMLPKDPEPASVVTVPMQPGDALFFNNLVKHRSLPNRTDGIRWSTDLRFWRPKTAHPARLQQPFPRPWVLRGAEPTPVGTWQGWYPR
jgi:hypothetical protein